MYTYQLRNDFATDPENQLQWEREPYRVLEVQDAMLYKGQLKYKNSSDWVNTDKVWIVNGHVEKIDANFHKGFEIHEISVDNIE